MIQAIAARRRSKSQALQRQATSNRRFSKLGLSTVLMLSSVLSTGLASDEVDLGSLVAGSGTFLITGTSDSGTGDFVNHAGDVNHDGIDDFIFGASRFGSVLISGGPVIRGDPVTMKGAAFVIFGKTTPLSDIDLATFTSGDRGFKILGARIQDWAGQSASGAGDVNGDGIDDVMVSSPQADPFPNDGVPTFDFAGVVYVIYGRDHATATFTDVDLLTFTTGPLGYRILGAGYNSRAGSAGNLAGDVNGDGHPDLILGNHVETFLGDVGHAGRSYAGISYVLFGKGSNVGADVELSTFLSGSTGFRIIGEQDMLLGTNVNGVGDLNGDGYDDVAVGASIYHNNEGIFFVVFGKGSGFTDVFCDTAVPFTAGFKITSPAPGAQLNKVVSAGDFNLDGHPDLVVSAPYYASYTGVAYVLFGPFPSDIDLATFLTSASTGFKLRRNVQNNEFCGYGLAGGSDVNGDGISDIVVGCSGTSSAGGATNAGAAYVIYGQDHSSATVADINLGTFVSGLTTGTVVSGGAANDRSGFSAAFADINDDGLADVLIGAQSIGNFKGGIYGVLGVSTVPTNEPTLSPTLAPTVASTTAPTAIAAVNGEAEAEAETNRAGHVVGVAVACALVFSGLIAVLYYAFFAKAAAAPGYQTTAVTEPAAPATAPVDAVAVAVAEDGIEMVV